jgi:hypothetical protein
MFGGFMAPLSVALNSIDPNPKPEPVKPGECRRCHRRKVKQARGGLSAFSTTLNNLNFTAAAELSVMLPNPADLDRYSKDHLEPDRIAKQHIEEPEVVKHLRNDTTPLAKSFRDWRFNYKDCPIDPTKQIRVLELLRIEEIEASGFGQLKDMVCCRLGVVVPGSDQYEALSYTWGPPGDLPIVVFPGADHDYGPSQQKIGKIAATPQLYAALQSLRKGGKRRIWVDQVCINQEDNAQKGEKMKQIGRMDEIYQNASQTVIWLGLADETTPRLKRLLDEFEKETESPGTLPTWLANTFGNGEKQNEQQTANYGALVKFLNREWFSRAWIFQEAVLSNNTIIQCGDSEFAYESLVQLSEAVNKTAEKASGYARSLMKATVGYNTLDLVQHAKQQCTEGDCQLMKKLQRGNLFETLALVLQHLRASYPKDLINAFIGVAYRPGDSKDPALHDVLTPFGAEGTVEDAWIKASWHIINTSQSLNILTAASGVTRKPYRLPSWVPDWSQCFKFASPITPPEFCSRFTASKGMTPSLKLSPNGKSLLVRGAVIDTIKSFTKFAFHRYYYMESHGDRTRQTLKVHEQTKDLEQELGGKSISSSVNGEELSHVVMRTMLADGAFGGKEIEENMHDIIDVYDLEEEIKQGSDTSDRELLQDVETWGLVAQKKGLFLTHGRRLGLAGHAQDELRDRGPEVPPSARGVGADVGDKIAIIGGSPVPVVLRPIGGASDGRQYQVICQCYVDGIMYGEGCKDLMEENFELV